MPVRRSRFTPLFAALLLASASWPAAACVTDPVVTNNADSGAGSLRDAIGTACAGSRITFAATVASPITLASQLEINQSLTIQGPGANLLTVSGNHRVRVFQVGLIRRDIDVTLSGLTIANGRAPSSSLHGGGINKLTTGVLTITNSTLSGNSVSGGIQGFGGAIFNWGGILNVVNSTLFDNSANSTNNSVPCNTGSGSAGGAIVNHINATLNITNSTLVGNSVNASGCSGSGSGGAIFNYPQSTTNLTNCTIFGNSVSSQNNSRGSVGGGITSAPQENLRPGIVNISNTIIAGNTVTADANNPRRGPDVWGAFISQGYNLIGNNEASSGFANGVNHDLVGSNPPLNPMLAPGLGSNDGPTQTIALLAGSPAIDHGSAAHDPATGDPITTDQRGFPRPADDPNTPDEPGGNGSDIGAFEYVPRQAPVARCRNLTVSAGPACTADASIDNNSYDPDVEDTITLAQSPAGPYALGATDVTLTVTDNHGAASSCVGTVTMADTTSPAITCPAALTVNGSLASGGATVPFTVSAADACDASLSLVTSRPSGSLFPFGTTTVLATATDDGGNSTSCSFAVTVLTPQTQVASLIAQINALVTGGALAPNKANPLITKLDQVVNNLDGGQTNTACGQLGAFLNQANAYIGNGTLTASQGQALISATNAIKASISC